MDLDTLIESEELTWRDILYEVIKGMDPWDIDLSELATRYSGKVNSMKEMNFRIPANVILVSAVLLRMKADILHPDKKESYSELADSFNYMFGEQIPDFDVLERPSMDELSLGMKPQRLLTRRVTAEELIGAIQRALEERGRRQSRLLSRQKDETVRTLVIEEEIDITRLIEETYRRTMEILSSREVALFSELAKTRDEIISVFLSLLHLSNTKKLSLTQERIYEEIYIRAAEFPD